MFARMKKTAFFINVGRGGSVVTDDLVAALNDGVIAGAGLDVTEPEPLPKDHPLWKAKNIIITPHMSAQSDLGPGDARAASCASRCAGSPPATNCCRWSTSRKVIRSTAMSATYATCRPAYSFVSR